MFEVVEQEQKPALAKVARQRRNQLVLSLAEAERPGEGRNDQVWVVDGSEGHGDDAVGEVVRDLVRYRERQASLADATRARDREQP